MMGTATPDSRSPTVADRLEGARRRGFVGRAAELELFRAALEAPEPPFSVLWIFGPGGVGKTTLLGALAAAARAAGREPVLVDMRAVEPSPPAFLRWRDPAVYRQVHYHVRADVVERLKTTAGRERERAFADLMFLHRGNPVAQAFWDWDTLGEVYADGVAAGDHDAIVALVELHEGRESAAIAAHWLARRSQDFAAFRGRGSEPVGFMAQLALHAASEDELAADAGARALWAHAQRHGEEVLAGRFLIDRDAYQAPSRSLNVVTMLSTQTWLTRSRLSWYYIVFADPDAAAPMMAHIGFERARDADFEVRRTPLRRLRPRLAPRERGRVARRDGAARARRRAGSRRRPRRAAGALPGRVRRRGPARAALAP